MILYIDTSSLVKVYMDEPGALETRTLVLQSDSLATSLITYVEMRGALARKLRSREISPAEHTALRRRFVEDWDRMTQLPIDQGTASSAASLAERHALRALDAIHLASAKGLAEKIADPLVFLSADSELSQAAVQEGLATSP